MIYMYIHTLYNYTLFLDMYIIIQTSIWHIHLNHIYIMIYLHIHRAHRGGCLSRILDEFWWLAQLGEVQLG